MWEGILVVHFSQSMNWLDLAISPVILYEPFRVSGHAPSMTAGYSAQTLCLRWVPAAEHQFTPSELSFGSAVPFSVSFSPAVCSQGVSRARRELYLCLHIAGRDISWDCFLTVV